jgi:hypothetical protein
LSPITNQVFPNAQADLGQRIGGAIVQATVGGLASVAGGGKFANGAITGAFQYLATTSLEDARQNALNANLQPGGGNPMDALAQAPENRIGANDRGDGYTYRPTDLQDMFANADFAGPRVNTPAFQAYPAIGNDYSGQATALGGSTQTDPCTFSRERMQFWSHQLMET